MDYQRLKTTAETWLPDMLNTLETLVSQESPSNSKPHLDALAGILAERFKALGAETTIIENENAAHHVKVEFDADGDAKPALLVGHFDTVWDVGTLETMPYKLDGDKVLGPGTFDMKGGIVIFEYAMRLITHLGLSLPRPVTMILNSDEETGSRTSRAFIEDCARESEYALILEPAMDGGVLKTARKTLGGFTIELVGRASHAGTSPEQGASAIDELARLTLKLHTMNDYERGITVNVGTVSGGTRTNVVAANARATVDVRAWTVADAEEIEARVRAITPDNPDVQINILSGGFGRGPMERTPESAVMFETVKALGTEMGVDLHEGSSGGGSDGNLTSAVGCPTLDGMGVHGDGAHASHEHVLIESLPQKAALLAATLMTL